MKEGNFSIPLSIDAGFDTQPDPQFNSSRTINLYLTYDRYGKNTKARLRRMRGIETKATFPAHIIYRAAFTLSNGVTNLTYVVIGNQFCQINTALVITPLGTINTDSGYAKIICNQLDPFPQILIVDGMNGWIWNGSTFTMITSPNFPGQPIDADYLDGYFIVLHGQTNQWVISNINDGFTYTPTNQANLTSKAGDNVAGVVVYHRRVYLFGMGCMESWFNAGNRVFPFQRDNNIAVDFGLLAIGSIARGFDRVFFLARTDAGVGAIMRITGMVPEPVSDSAFEFVLRTYTNPGDAVAYVTRTDDGHVQYVINFTTDNATWVYDDETGKMFQKQMLNGSRWVGQVHFYFNNTHYLGAYNSGILYEEDEAFLTNDGEPIYYEWTSPLLSDSDTHNQIRVDTVELDCIRGIGTATPPYDIPSVFLQVSMNSGQYFGNMMPATLTKMGDYTSRTRWLSIGSFNGNRDIVFRVSATLANDFGIFGGWIKGFVGAV